MVLVTFTQPDLLIFLAGIPIIIFAHLASQKYAKTRALMFANFEAIKRVVGKKREITNIPKLSGNWFLLIFRLITYSILVIAVAGTTIWIEGLASEQDFILAIDSSGSMLAQDILPSRFQAAKNSGAFFIDQLQNTGRVGIISFAGTPIILQPMTDNHIEAKNALSGMDISLLSGTDIASTIMISTNLLSTSSKAKSIVLVTDGRQTVATPINPAITYARDNGVIIHVIGLGTEQGAAFTEDGLITSLDIESLQTISNQTQGRLHIVSDESALESALIEIADLKQGIRPFDASYYLMIIAFILLFLEWGLLNTVFRNLP